MVSKPKRKDSKCNNYLALPQQVFLKNTREYYASFGCMGAGTYMNFYTECRVDKVYMQ